MAVESPKVDSGDPRARRSKLAPLGIIFGLLGLLLFAYFVRRAGVGEILAGIQRLGAGFLLVLAISSTPLHRSRACLDALRRTPTSICRFAMQSGRE